MKRIGFTAYFMCCTVSLIYSQQEPIKIEGNAQGTSYHITYFDEQNRDLQSEIDKILIDFDKSVSTYLPNSIISRINSNEKNNFLYNVNDCFKCLY